MATQLSASPLVVGQALFADSTTQQHNLGERVVSNDGRAFRYSRTGAVALVAGTLQQSGAQVANHQNLTPSAAAIGATEITLTLGATAATANQYAGGYAVITVTPGQGYTYKIKSNPAISSAGSGTIQLEDPIVVALTTSSRVDLVLNPYSGVIINPATATGLPVGVANIVSAIGSFSWLTCAGIANVLADGAVTVGTNLVASNATAGAVEPLAGVQASIGIAMNSISTTEYGAVFISLN